MNAARTCLQGPAFGTSASVYDKQRVVATASGPTFATEDKTVHILLLTGALSSFHACISACACLASYNCNALHIDPAQQHVLR